MERHGSFKGLKLKMIFLDFEKPIEELHQKIQELRHVQTEESALDISKEIDTLRKK